MKKMIRSLLCFVLVAVLLVGCGGKSGGEGTKEPASNGTTRVVYMGKDQDIPCLELVNSTYAVSDIVEWTYDQVGQGFGIAEEHLVDDLAPVFNWDYGEGVYQSRYMEVMPKDYQTLVDEMQKAGYQLYSSSDINKNCYYSLLTNEGYVYSITYFMETEEMFVSVSKDRPVSPYLLQDNASTKMAAVEGLQPTLTMLNWQEGGGDNYIVQLKNGHYLVFDGGTYLMLATMLDFMEANAPEGEVPVVDAWFVTHGHYDHTGWTAGFYGGYDELHGVLRTGEASERVRVNGVYFNQTENAIIANTIYGWRSDGYRNLLTNNWPYKIEEAAKYMVTEDGSQTPIYRPQAGQVLHFNGATVEIPYCQEQLTFAEYQMDLNAASTWYVVRAEDRVFLEGGDSENVNMDYVKAAYTKDYDVMYGQADIMNAFHHGHNIYDDHIEAFHAPIVFYTTKEMFKWATVYTEANKKMLEIYDVDYYYYGDGAYQYNFTTNEVKALN